MAFDKFMKRKTAVFPSSRAESVDDDPSSVSSDSEHEADYVYAVVSAGINTSCIHRGSSKIFTYNWKKFDTVREAHVALNMHILNMPRMEWCCVVDDCKEDPEQQDLKHHNYNSPLFPIYGVELSGSCEPYASMGDDNDDEFVQHWGVEKVLRYGYEGRQSGSKVHVLKDDAGTILNVFQSARSATRAMKKLKNENRRQRRAGEGTRKTFVTEEYAITH